MIERCCWGGLLLLSAILALPAGAIDTLNQDAAEQPESWAAYEMAELESERAESNRSYLSFLNRSTLSCGIYFLPAGGEDGQSPHRQDEVYYVEKGRGKLQVEGTDIDVRPGSILFVKAHAEHRFHSIEEDLTLLVFFSTAPVDE